LTAASINSSRFAKIAAFTAASAFARCANVISRSAGDPTRRACSSAAFMSTPPVPAFAITSPVVGS
jgi:hypothetical protein